MRERCAEETTTYGERPFQEGTLGYGDTLVASFCDDDLVVYVGGL